MRLVYRREWRKVAALERRIARECDLSRFRVGRGGGVVRAASIPIAPRASAASAMGSIIVISIRHWIIPPVYRHHRPNYVFTGTMDYQPNVDAVDWFATRYPAADPPQRAGRAVPHRRQQPQPGRAEAGSRTGWRVRHRPGAGCAAYVAHATASVAPMRIARGIQNKVLEAMAMARPVVLTSGALEGIEADPVTEAILADNAEALRRRLLPPGDQRRRRSRSAPRRGLVSSATTTGT